MGTRDPSVFNYLLSLFENTLSFSVLSFCGVSTLECKIRKWTLWRARAYVSGNDKTGSFLAGISQLCQLITSPTYLESLRKAKSQQG